MGVRIELWKPENKKHECTSQWCYRGSYFSQLNQELRINNIKQK